MLFCKKLPNYLIVNQIAQDVCTNIKGVSFLVINGLSHKIKFVQNRMVVKVIIKGITPDFSLLLYLEFLTKICISKE
jgi:hypothetical protein